MKVAETKIAKNAELVKLIQTKVKTVLNEADITIESVKEELSQLYGTQDAEILYAVLKTGVAVEEEAKEDGEEPQSNEESPQKDLEV